MDRSLAENKVLRKLDIPDFRHMTKDKVVSFISMVPQMDPEVAKRALEQFPAFAETGLAIVAHLKDSLIAVIDSNSEGTREFNARCQEVLNVLEAELSRETLTDEGRKLIIDGILEVISVMGEKGSEDKALNAGLFRDILAAGVFVVVCLAGALGLRLNSSSGK